jgi:hypothetical protein
MNRSLKFRIYSFLDKAFHHFTLEEGYPQGIAGDVNEPQQYTGLNDKNGNPIYEGDFIRGQFDHGPAGYREEIVPVIWTNENGYQWNYWDLSTIEVIGNKYQWPCKKPGSFDHNGECLICDCWATDCPFFKLSK